ncbi:MAG: IS66 family insertion sequence element accessory protein TnpB [Deltaproteobacteria bacterium]|nr:IS66 family insertion sequence element accessory protein TnpB [Deltaproteobacteria bacterium]
MIYGLSGQIRYYLYAPSTDMRKGFDALSGIVRNELLQDPLCGDAFIFINRRRNLLKLLAWDQTGFVIYYKRLESGTFELPAKKNGHKSVVIQREELVMILEGISLEKTKRKRRYFYTNFVD